MQQVHFSADAALKSIIGKDLIHSDYVAVIELIKNSKDAGATDVQIYFENETSTDEYSSITIIDNGKGMSKNDIIDKWLTIAYSEKKHDKKKKLAGNKGIGRFSCDRLGILLDLYSIDDLTHTHSHLHINWENFENKKKTDIVKIPLSLDTFTTKKLKQNLRAVDFAQGTILHISKLRDTWHTSKLARLIAELEKFSLSLDEHFKVTVHSKNKDEKLLKKLGVPVKRNILDNVSHKTSYIKSSIDSTGKQIATTIYYQGSEILSYKVDNPYNFLKNIKTEIHYIDPIARAYFTGSLGVKVQEYGSIFLFYNNFRVSPYGDPGNDWLGLDKRKAQGVNRNFGTRELFGRIDIDDEESVFDVLSTREGMKKNKPFQELVGADNDEEIISETSKKQLRHSYLINIIRQLESFVVNIIKWDKILDIQDPSSTAVSPENVLKNPRRYKLSSITPEHIDLIKESLLRSQWSIKKITINRELIKNIAESATAKYNKFLEDFIDKIEDREYRELLRGENIKARDIMKRGEAILADTQAALRVAQDEITNKKKVIEKKELEINTLTEKKKQSESENMFLRAISSKDTDSLLNFMHKIIGDILTIKREVNYYTKRNFQGKQITVDELNDTFDIIRKKADSIYKVAQFATYGNYKVATDISTVDVIKCIKDYVAFLQEEKIYRNDISITLNIPNDLTLIKPIRVLNLTIMLDNIIANSIKAKANNIEITMTKKNGNLHWVFTDNGNGLDSRAEKNKIFNKGYTFTKGSGLGLYFVKSFTEEELNAKLLLEDVNKGFALEVVIPCN